MSSRSLATTPQHGRFQSTFAITPNTTASSPRTISHGKPNLPVLLAKCNLCQEKCTSGEFDSVVGDREKAVGTFRDPKQHWKHKQ